MEFRRPICRVNFHRISRQLCLAGPYAAHVGSEFRCHLHDHPFCQGCSMIESDFIDEIAVVDCGVSVIPALPGNRIYGLCRSFRKYVVLSSPGNLEFVNSTTNFGRRDCRVRTGIRNGHILIIAAFYGSPFCVSGSCSPSDRTPHCATAQAISVFFLERYL